MTLCASSTLSISKYPSGTFSICCISFSLASAICGRKFCSRSRTHDMTKRTLHICLKDNCFIFNQLREKSEKRDDEMKKKDALSHRCFLGLSLSAGSCQPLAWGEASHSNLTTSGQKLWMNESLFLNLKSYQPECCFISHQIWKMLLYCKVIFSSDHVVM